MVPDAVNLDSVRRALVVKLRHHGDVLLSSPVFQVLRNRAPEAQIDALVYDETRELIDGHPAIDRIHAIGRGWRRQGLAAHARQEGALVRTLQQRRYQLVVFLTNQWRCAWLAQALRPRWSVAPARPGALWRWSFTHQFKLTHGTPRHNVETNLDALRRIGIYPEPAEKRLVLDPGAAAQAKVDGMLAAAGLAPGAFIQMHPTSRWMFKAWPEHSSAELVRRLVADGHRIVITGAPDAREKAIVGRILAAAGVAVTDFSGQLGLRELAALTTRARLFFGMDSAPMHIAAAVGTPVVVLFGPSGDHEWGPWGVAHHIVTSAAHPCRPCGNDGCGGGKVSECLTTLPVARVHAAINEMLARP
jgi:heptosyltransferase-3